MMPPGGHQPTLKRKERALGWGTHTTLVAECDEMTLFAVVKAGETPGTTPIESVSRPSL